jgi:hypothetical protein
MASGATLGATPPRPSSEQHSSHRLGGGPLVPLDQVPVHVLGDRDAGMAEDLGDDMHGVPWPSISEAPECRSSCGCQ